MSVELLDTPRFFGFRVRRQILGKTYQEYFSLKQDGKRLRGAPRARVKAAAEQRDAELARHQETAQNKRAKEVHIDGDGQVRGILCRLKAEKSGNHTPVFQIGVMSLQENRIVNTTVSINKFGIAEAWRRAVDFYAAHKKISKRSSAYRSLLAAQPTPARLERLLAARRGATGARRKAATANQRTVKARTRSRRPAPGRSTGGRPAGR